MTKSRTAPWLTLALAAASADAAASAQPLDADAVIAARQTDLRSAMRLECPRATDEDEIVVCGARDEEERYRIDPAFRATSSGERAGDAQRAALAIDTSRCTAVGPNQQCTRGLDMIGIGMMVARAVAQAIANQD